MGEDVRADRSDIGIGVFANKDFAVGEYILTFRGPIVPDSPNGGADEANLIQIDIGQYVRPEPVGVYVNHSCRPNACLRSGLALFALRPIRRNDEIRFDYSTCIFHDPWTMPCLCGEPCCRELVADFASLPYRLRDGYMELDAVPEFIARHYRLDNDRPASPWRASALRVAH